MKQFLMGASAFTLALAGGAANAVPLVPNKAITTQTGKNNTATISQTAALNGVVMIEQVGNKNVATSGQGGIGNYDTTVQNGNGNTAANDSSGSANRSDIRQGCPVSLCGANLTTDNNSATVTQTTGSANNWNFVFQSPGSSGSGGGGNTVSVMQSGNGGNSGDPAITPGLPGGYTVANTELVQYGTNSSITVTQAGDSQRATVYQGAAFNTATNPPGSHVSSSPSFYDPYGTTDNNTATVIQDSAATSAQAFVYQGASDNVATVTQSGLSQFAEIRQSTEEVGFVAGEGNNSAAVTQNATAANTLAFVFQQGISNSATVTQSGANSTTSVYQAGVGNKAVVSQ